MLGREIHDNVTSITVQSFDNMPARVYFGIGTSDEKITEEVLPTVTMEELLDYLNDNYSVDVKY